MPGESGEDHSEVRLHLFAFVHHTAVKGRGRIASMLRGAREENDAVDGRVAIFSEVTTESNGGAVLVVIVPPKPSLRVSPIVLGERTAPAGSQQLLRNPAK